MREGASGDYSGRDGRPAAPAPSGSDYRRLADVIETWIPAGQPGAPPPQPAAAAPLAQGALINISRPAGPAGPPAAAAAAPQTHKNNKPKKHSRGNVDRLLTDIKQVRTPRGQPWPDAAGQSSYS